MGKGLDLGAESPRIKLCWVPPRPSSLYSVRLASFEDVEIRFNHFAIVHGVGDFNQLLAYLSSIYSVLPINL